MFKLPSTKTLLTLVCLFSFFKVNPIQAAKFKRNLKSTAIIEYIIDESNIMATSDASDWNIGEILPIISQNSKIGIFAYSELVSMRNSQPGRYELKLRLLRQSRKYLIQQGDYVKRLNLDTENSDYIGTTDLLVKNNEVSISSKYKPLTYQGVSIGETAQTLYQNEVLLTFSGNAYYGILDNLSVGSYLPLNVLTGINGSFKFKFYESDSATLTAGLNYAEIKDQTDENNQNEKNERTLNFNFYWDSVSSDTLISHIYMSIGLIKWEGAGDAAAIKALGSSSFQTGYEIIMSNWDRFLVGPSYNFDSKTLGGYISYVWIYDRFHAQISLNTTNVTSLTWRPGDGYYGFFDLYWRF